jgi:hypothetical protein
MLHNFCYNTKAKTVRLLHYNKSKLRTEISPVLPCPTAATLCEFHPSLQSDVQRNQLQLLDLKAGQSDLKMVNWYAKTVQ